MKNIYTILESIGITVPEDKKTDFEAAFNENYKTVNEVEKLRTARDSYKTQLDTATEALKKFEGVDVSELQTRISTLSDELAQSKAEFDEKMAQRDFDDFISSFAQKFKVRDLQAVLPFLDMEKLKVSKNRDADVEAAFTQVKKEKGYLFEDEGAPRVVSFTNGPDKETNDSNTKANEALRQLFGKD